MSNGLRSIRDKRVFLVLAVCAIAALILAFAFGGPADQMKAVIAALVVLLIASVIAYMVKK
jgi:multisubunit Na+/H+ antiporter MnhG subunit